jgi:hypothetical protein
MHCCSYFGQCAIFFQNLKRMSVIASFYSHLMKKMEWVTMHLSDHNCATSKWAKSNSRQANERRGKPSSIPRALPNCPPVNQINQYDSLALLRWCRTVLGLIFKSMLYAYNFFVYKHWISYDLSTKDIYHRSNKL